MGDERFGSLPSCPSHTLLRSLYRPFRFASLFGFLVLLSFRPTITLSSPSCKNTHTMAATNPQPTDNRPPVDEHGRIAHYRPTTLDNALTRGILLSASGGKPAFQWEVLKKSLAASSPSLNGVSYFVNKKLDAQKLDDVKTSVEKAFSLAFPHSHPALVNVFAGSYHGKSGSFVSLKTPFDSVRAYDIIATAALQEWTVAGQKLGAPWYVGLQTTELLQAIRFDKVPQACKDDFAFDLSDYIETHLDPTNKVQLVDLWEEQKRDTKEGEWKFAGTLLALVEVKPSSSNLSDLRHIVDKWPGYLHWLETYLIELAYAGRWSYCARCKHTAQALNGPLKRHADDKCINIICGKCGHRGHDSSGAIADKGGAYKRICDEGIEKRRKAAEARKKQKTTHNQTLEKTSQNEATETEGTKKGSSESVKAELKTETST